MKKVILIISFGIVFISIGYFGLQIFSFAKGVKEDIGQNNRDLILVTNDYEIDLTELDSVRENLNGFWIGENDPNRQEILWLNFESDKNLTGWKTIPFTDEIKQTEILPIKSCPTIATLIKIDDEIHIQFVSLAGQYTTKIKQLTKTKFKIGGITYLRHKGYEFLK